MRPIITPAESARLDQAHGDVTTLMERAGLAVALTAVGSGAGYGSRVVVLAGPGNNGGDGLVAARVLRSRGVDVRVLMVADPTTAPAAAALRRARQAGVVIGPMSSPFPADLVIDALWGGGFRPPLDPRVAAWIEAGIPVISVDVPSGLDPLTGSVADVAFTADRTVTFHALRTGHVTGEGPDRCGIINVADIGLVGGDPTFRLAEEVDAPRPPRRRTDHKWSAGSVLVVGGSSGMVGAAILAGRSALAFGAGAVGVAAPDLRLVQSIAPELLAFPLDGLPSRFRVVVVGPGLGSESREVMGRLVDDPRPLVVDADALTSVTAGMLADRSGPTILTPHADEFRRLTGEQPFPAAARAFAADTGAVIVLKGNPTWVIGDGVPWVVDRGGPELATIGTGDVLAGMIAALTARGLQPSAAAVSGTFWHGVAAAHLRLSGTVTADMLSRHIGRFAWEAGR